MFYVYVLESQKNDSLYIGSTSDLQRRLKEHNQGLSTSTKRYAPWTLIYYEASLNHADAIRREKWLKSTHGRRMLKLRIREYMYGKGQQTE